MRIFSKTIILGVAAASLSACGTCTNSLNYDGVPYTEERTAGTGLFFNDNACHHAQAETVAVTEPAAGETAEQKPVFTHAEKVFQREQAK